MVDVAHGTPRTRPPTPPKENVETAAKLPTDQFYQGTLGQNILLDTPNDSPSSSSEHCAGSAGKFQKRVIFSPWNSYHKHSDKSAILEARIRPLPPSKECIALHKSILKASAEKNSPRPDFPHPLMLDPDQGITVMLQSVTQHLTNASRDSRLDTYKNLIGCLSTYENVPEMPLLANNLSAFLDFIRQDILAKQPGTTTFDVELATNALKILSTMLYTQGLVDVMPDEFCTFAAEQAVSSIERGDIPKVMIDHHMQMLARQKLPQRIFNPDRVSRLLTALHGLELRLKGNRVIGLKLMIYHRLLTQAKPLMVGRAEQWFEFLIASVSSSIKDIRIRAIAFGTDAALALGTTAAVSQACLDLLDGEIPSGTKTIDYLGARMLELLNDKDGAIHVPQIWILVLLFLRSRSRQIERWEHLTSWLGVMQQSFNSGDVKVKRQANAAWNRFMSAISLDTSTSLSVIKMLRQPIITQLDRKSSDKSSKSAKQVARSSYCYLLYFAFRPGVPHEQLDLYWDNLVAPALSLKTWSTKSDQEFACHVLAAMLSSQQPRLWDQNRAHQMSLMKPEELPCLDPRWVRHRAAKIQSILEQLLVHTNCSPSDPSPFLTAWQSFVKALGDAASKEVKVSMESMAAFAQITSMLNRYWHHKSDTSETVLRRLEYYVAIINETVAKVGFQPFIEKRLLFDPSGGAFEAAETPSSRSSHPRRILNTPVMYMLDLLVKNPRDIEASSTYQEAVHTLLTIALRPASGRGSRLATLRQLATDILSGPGVAVSSSLVFWDCLAKHAECALSLPQTTLPTSDSHQYPGQDFRQSVALLEIGIRGFRSELYPSWKSLSDAVVKGIEDQVGESGILLAYTEPLARIVHECIESSPDACLRYGTYMVRQARWPVSRQDLERARKQLWGPGPTLFKNHSLDPFDYIYSMLEDLLLSTYSNLQPAAFSAGIDFISSIGSFLQLCPLSMKAVCLKRMQKGLGVWIEDANAVLSHSNGLSPIVRTLWKTVLDGLQSVQKPDSSCLAMVQDLLTAGFQSRHKTITNDLITTWNQTFARAETLAYPAPLRIVLTKLRSSVDIILPDFVDEEESEIMSSPFNFVDSQEEEEDIPAFVIAAAKINCLPNEERTFPARTKGSNRSRTTAVSLPGTPGTTTSRRALEMTPKARLRHDSSQILFAAIESSPLTSESNETQHLTEHQKEIRERQEHDAAAMFRDIRSSPRRSRSAERPLELVLHKKQTSSKPLDADAEPSPTFPPGDVIMNEFLGSSPTPHSSSKSSVDHQVDRDPGSSPPSSPLLIRPAASSDAEPALGQVGELNITPTLMELVTQQPKSSNAVGTAPSLGVNILDGETGYLDSRSAIQACVEPGPAQPSKQMTSEVNGHLSDSDVFVDALGDSHAEKGIEDSKDGARSTVGNAVFHAIGTIQEPTVSYSATASRPETADAAYHDTGGTSAVVDSVYVEDLTTPTEDELVREQLLRDVEEASSQADSQLPEWGPSPSGASKVSSKRKKGPNDGTRARKKAKLPPPCSQNVEVVVETRRSDQANDAHIIIDDRPAAGTKTPVSPLIKQERSPSPVTASQPACRRFSVEKVSARRRTRSMTGDSALHWSGSENSVSAGAPGVQLETGTSHSGMEAEEQGSRKRRRVEESQPQEDPAEGRPRPTKTPRRSNSVRSQTKRPVDASSAANPRDPVVQAGDMTCSQMEELKQNLLSTDNAGPEPSNAGSELLPPHSSGGDSIPQTWRDDADQNQQAASASTSARSPGQRVLDRLRSLLHDLRQVTLWPAEEKEMMGVALNVVGSIHEAGFRNGRREQ